MIVSRHYQKRMKIPKRRCIHCAQLYQPIGKSKTCTKSCDDKNRRAIVREADKKALAFVKSLKRVKTFRQTLQWASPDRAIKVIEKRLDEIYGV